MEKQKQYRIVCEYPSDKWVVQELIGKGWNEVWMSAYHCTDKGKEGYEEAKQWIEKQDNIIDRIDDIRANSVTDEEFEKAHGMSLDEMAERMSKKWIDQYTE